MKKILCVVGGVSEESLNKKLALSMKEIGEDICDIEIYFPDKLPIFNKDLEKDLPEEVSFFKEKVRSCDGVLFVTPEYDYSIPAVLKNAIEWGTRPFEDNVWDEKPVAIAGASTGMVGTARAQMALRQIMVEVNMLTFNRPQVLVGNAQEKFDKDGKLIDEKTRQKARELIVGLVSWIDRLS